MVQTAIQLLCFYFFQFTILLFHYSFICIFVLLAFIVSISIQMKVLKNSRRKINSISSIHVIVSYIPSVSKDSCRSPIRRKSLRSSRLTGKIPYYNNNNSKTKTEFQIYSLRPDVYTAKSRL